MRSLLTFVRNLIWCIKPKDQTFLSVPETAMYLNMCQYWHIILPWFNMLTISHTSNIFRGRNHPVCHKKKKITWQNIVIVQNWEAPCPGLRQRPYYCNLISCHLCVEYYLLRQKMQQKRKKEGEFYCLYLQSEWHKNCQNDALALQNAVCWLFVKDSKRAPYGWCLGAIFV